MNEVRRTWQEWDALSGSRIADPDGFRGRRATADGLYTEAEFEARIGQCTVKFGAPVAPEPESRP